MEPTAASKSSIERKRSASGARSEPQASEAHRESERSASGARSEPQASEARPASVPIGRVVGAHGLRGGLRVRAFADAAENLLELKRVALARGEDDPEAKPFDVRGVAPGRPGELRVDLEGLRTRDDALARKGLLVMAAPGELRALGPGEYYGYQLLGCRVEGEDGTTLGSVREIWETGASDLLVVVDAEGAQHLLPAALMREVDADARRIVVEILPGLLARE